MAGTFELIVRDTVSVQTFEIRSFVGEDASGSFGLKANHVRFMTTLNAGLCRFRDDSEWTYLATTGGILYFRENRLGINCRRAWTDCDAGHIVESLEAALKSEAQSLAAIRASLDRLEQEMLRRLWALGIEAPFA